MRTWLRGKYTLLFITCAVVLAIPAIALADTLTVNDVSAGGDTTKLAGASGTAGAVITAVTETGDANGCNATGSAQATLTLTSSNTSVANFGGNASASQLVNGCGTTFNFPYQVPSGATVGDTATITATATGGKTGSTYTSDSFTVTVIAPTPSDTTGPVITPHVDGTLGNGGWYVSDVAVTWDVVDNESAISSSSGCAPASVTADTAGTTFTCTATSAGGTNSQSVTIKRDATAPNVQCGSADGNWHANDGGSGLANSGDGSFNLSTSVADGSETATASTNSRDVADAVGHSATAGPITGNKVDRKAPTFDACPTAGPFTQGSTPSVSINATDGGSGLDNTNSTLTRSVDTTNIGNTSVTFTAQDNVANSGTKTCTYDVDYKWDGFFQPIDNKDPNTGNFIINKAKLGSTVPVKFSLGGDKGLNIFASGYPQVSAAATCSPSSSTDTLEEYATATVSSLKYDSTANQYIYNWKTDPKYTVGTCRQLIVKLADGTEHRATFSFFK